MTENRARPTRKRVFATAATGGHAELRAHDNDPTRARCTRSSLDSQRANPNPKR